jgi:hypothetical protein
MRNYDTILLEQAYTKIHNLEEAKIRDLVAAAALGLSSAHGATLAPDDQEDRMNPPIVQQVQHKEEGETIWHKAKVAYDKAVANPKVRPDINQLKDISNNKEYARRYIEFLILNGQEVPDIIKQADSNYNSSVNKAKEAPDKE